MLTKSEYDILMDIKELPSHGFPEGECPPYISWPKVCELIQLGYMEEAMLALPGDDPAFPNGRSWFKISALGYHLIEEYEEELSKRKFDAISSIAGHIVSAFKK